MSMHLVGPWLNTISTKKRKATVTKAKQEQWQLEWAAANKQRKREGKGKISFEQWLDEKHGKVTAKAAPKTNSKTPTLVIPEGRSTQHIPSNFKHATGVCAKKEPQQYTGTECIGIAVMHKSCLQPVFSQKAAEDAAKMRRG